MDLKLYNTLSRKIEEFEPINENYVGLYCCGPTVYNYAHIGNLRTYIFEDILKRVLGFCSYDVKHVMNITDVGHLTDDGDDGEDKLLKSAREKKKSVYDIASFYTDAFFNDTKRLNIIKPDINCEATKHIGDMIALIKRLEEKGYTYVSGGNVYFSIDKFPEYGKMALLDKQDLQSGARIVIDENKKNPKDFVLWFTNSKFENQVMIWDSPWGKGYPGWHLECSAMSMKYLGDHFDIHCGGIDHIPVHHTNEIAQSEAATGKKWVNYWLHGEFLILEKGKMSKSKGSFLTLQNLIDNGYDALDYRYYCLGAHYRAQLKFSFASLDGARSARLKLVRKIKSLLALKKEELPKEFSNKYLDNFFSDVINDLNIPKSLANLWAVLKDSELSVEEKLASVYKMDTILGLSLKDIEIEEDSLSPEFQKMIDDRLEAKKNRNFEEADRLRDLLLENGIIIKDTAKGTEWSKK